MAEGNPRIPLLEKENISQETVTLYEALIAQRGVVPNMFKVLSYNPEIAKGVAGFLKPLLSDGALKGWYKELVAVRISILHNSEYAIRAHSISASKKGASAEQIAGVKEFENGPFNEKEKAGFRIADKLHEGARQVDDAAYGEVKKFFSDSEIVELFLTASAFELFPRFIDGLKIPITAMPAGK